MKIINANDLLNRINNAENNFKADHVEELENGDSFCDGVLSGVFNIRKMVKQAEDVNTQMHQIIKWNPVKIKKCESGELYDFSFDCLLPLLGDDVLITTKNGEVKMTTFYIDDDGAYFADYDAEDVVAWAELPMPYNKKL